MTKQKSNFLPYLLAIIIVIIYVLLAVHYVPIIEPVMDEGTYLLKGKWFWENTYQPFQEKGPLTNKPPLAFYSLGISQILFTPGLESGRYFAVFLGVLLLIGQWLTVKRLAGAWWATASIALYAISPAWIIYYSRAMTQVVTSLLIVWSLYFLLGEDRKQSQLMVGAILAALVVMVRQNLLPLFVFTLLYILWENGLKKSIVPILVGSIVFIGFNVIYWPEIYLHIWQPYFPGLLNRFITSLFHLNLPSGDLGSDYLVKNYNPVYELQVLFDSMRYFFIPIIVSIFTFILLFPKRLFNEKKHRKTAFLAFSFIFLVALHYGYAVYENVVLYSFPAYIAFYLPLAVTLIPLFFKEISSPENRRRQWMLSIAVVFISAGIGLSLYREIAPFFMNLNLPSISQHTFHGPYKLWDVLLNRYQISIRTQEFIIPTIVGFLSGWIILLSAFIYQKIKSHKNKSVSFGSSLILITLAIGILLTPTFILSGHNSIPTCNNSNIPERYEAIGKALQKIIPAGSHVYLEGHTPIIILYLPDIQVFPSQLNMYFYYHNGGDTNYLERISHWNDELALRWIREADFLFLDQTTYENRFLNLSPELQAEFQQLPNHITLDPCDSQSTILIFRRTP